tara:strand:- start:25330 stop:26079 length:750 start_codon:yes stop_codon:yes gene_type:complete
MNLNLAGKNVLVTGSSHGIGLHIARQFAAEGCRVALNGRSDIAPDVIHSVPGSFSVIGDVSNEHGAKNVIAETVQKLGGLDVVICNVGSGRSVKPGQENIKAWKDAFDINFYSTTCVVEAARSYLKVSQGVIITISSICGCQVIPAAPVTYSVAKAALNAYVKGIARPLGDDGVRICGIAPGNILFEGSVWDTKLAENPDSVSQMLDQEVPLHKLGTPAEVASLALFLASPKSNYSTGDVWIVDGGQTR